jgi:hypothetical protein
MRGTGTPGGDDSKLIAMRQAAVLAGLVTELVTVRSELCQRNVQIDSAWAAAARVVGTGARRSTDYARGRDCSELTLASRAGRRPGSVPICPALTDAHDVQ